MSDAEWAVIEPGKEVRSMPAKALTVVPQKPERLGGERAHRRVEVEQHHMLAFEP
jgi:membrane carboxypeptidase/penicillin-binding protein PbpC